MIALLRAILANLLELISSESAAKADIDSQLAAQSAAIEHLRVLIEGDSIPTAVGAPTFTPGGDK